MSSMIFNLNTDNDITTEDVPVELNTSITTDTSNIGYVAVIYHECTLSQVSGFFKLEHESSKILPTDDNDYIKFYFDINVLSNMINDLKEWHVQERGTIDSSNKGYYNQEPLSAIPNQNDVHAIQDVDNNVYYEDTQNIETELKYPFKLKILPMRVYAAYGSNITSLITMKETHYDNIKSTIDNLKTNLLNAFLSANGMLYSQISNTTNLGRRLWCQTQYLMAMKLSEDNTSLSDRVINMFHSPSTTTTSTIIDNNGETINVQTTEFIFESGDEIQFGIKLNVNSTPFLDLSTIGYGEPNEYTFKLRLRIKE